MAMLFFAMCVICYIWLPVFYASTPYASDEHGAWMRLLQIIIAVVMCAALLSIIPDNLGRFTDVGKWTLLIYLLHPPIVKLSKMGCSSVGIPMTPNVPVAVLITIVTVFLIYKFRNNKVFKYLS